jgi:hypothetical protein
MPGLALKMHFMDNQNWAAGLRLPVQRDLTVREGQDLEVEQGIVIEVKDAPRDITLGQGSDVEV